MLLVTPLVPQGGLQAHCHGLSPSRSPKVDSHKSMLAGTRIASLPCSAWCSQSHTQGRACASVCKVRALRLLFAWGYPCAQHWEQSFISELLLPPSLPSDASQAARCFLITDHTFKATGILTLTWPVFSRRSDLRAFLCQPLIQIPRLCRSSV